MYASLVAITRAGHADKVAEHVQRLDAARAAADACRDKLAPRPNAIRQLYEAEQAVTAARAALGEKLASINLAREALEIIRFQIDQMGNILVLEAHDHILRALAIDESGVGPEWREELALYTIHHHTLYLAVTRVAGPDGDGEWAPVGLFGDMIRVELGDRAVMLSDGLGSTLADQIRAGPKSCSEIPEDWAVGTIQISLYTIAPA